ncbi:unnamed protein product [Natator depressus]
MTTEEARNTYILIEQDSIGYQGEIKKKTLRFPEAQIYILSLKTENIIFLTLFDPVRQ